jgi:hypothetical protein
MDGKQEVAFLNHLARPDSDLAMLGHRNACSAKDFCPETEVLETPMTPGQKFFAPLFFKKAASFL